MCNTGREAIREEVKDAIRDLIEARRDLNKLLQEVRMFNPSLSGMAFDIFLQRGADECSYVEVPDSYRALGYRDRRKRYYGEKIVALVEEMVTLQLADVDADLHNEIGLSPDVFADLP